MAIGNALVARHVQSGIVFHAALLPYACGCSTQTTSTINLKRSTLHPHEGQADRPNTPSDSVNLGSNPGPPARESASNRCVFVVSSLAGIVLKLPRVSAPANASVPTRDAKRQGVGRERPQGSLKAVFESSDVERFGWGLVGV